ncbi:MAG: phosphatidylserine decarboxylase family protein [Blastocatellia bacterium]|jgi:phosphatidylserine decarboxylase|nr:phosphatidylserine decarboxylase family protein [Blastocatellia bacterium]MBK6428528.1 phosphatidylserine decarboxylase family protein [Blastocatellia bacterium]
MAREGIPFIALFAFPALLAGIAGAFTGNVWLLGFAILCAALAAFMAYFFRDPSRAVPTEPGIVVSPADGKVLVVEHVDASDPRSATQVSIFLSPLDVHINRAPIGGTIESVTYKPGEFRVASRKIASEVNEQNVIEIRGADMAIVARQIAGLVARRIVCWKKAGDRVATGERIGLMKFSSRMDVVMPSDIEVLCRIGDRVVGGETVIGRKIRD